MATAAGWTRRRNGLVAWRPAAAGPRLAGWAAARWTRGAASHSRARRVAVVQSDIVASTVLLEAAGSRYPALLVRHRRLIASAVTCRGGRFLAHAGDGTLAVFDGVDAALLASVEAQRALGGPQWPDGLVPRVRMGVHVGDVYEIDGEPVGLAIHHGARIMAAAHPGQIMVSPEAADAAEVAGVVGHKRGGLALADAGWHELRDHCGQVRLRQVVADGLTVVLPATRDDVSDPETSLGRRHAG